MLLVGCQRNILLSDLMSLTTELYNSDAFDLLEELTFHKDEISFMDPHFLCLSLEQSFQLWGYDSVGTSKVKDCAWVSDIIYLLS